MWSTKHPCADCGTPIRRDAKRCAACYKAYRQPKARLCPTCNAAEIMRHADQCRACYEARITRQNLDECLYTWEEYCFMRSYGIDHHEAMRRLQRAFKLKERSIHRRITAALESKGHHVTEHVEWPLYA